MHKLCPSIPANTCELAHLFEPLLDGNTVGARPRACLSHRVLVLPTRHLGHVYVLLRQTLERATVAVLVVDGAGSSPTARRCTAISFVGVNRGCRERSDNQGVSVNVSFMQVLSASFLPAHHVGYVYIVYRYCTKMEDGWSRESINTNDTDNGQRTT